ncbi:MAG: hypothetical protein IJN53_04450 [Oscillospiraceae bacterium]|nr:hypothetical protein [Oscillospiraceae bacterium]
MAKKIIVAVIVALVILILLYSVSMQRYQIAVQWIEDGVFSKATCYIDEFPFIIELYDPGFVSYAYAGEAMEYGRFDEAMELLKPLAEKNYRDSVQMLKECMEKVANSPNK